MSRMLVRATTWSTAAKKAQPKMPVISNQLASSWSRASAPPSLPIELACAVTSGTTTASSKTSEIGADETIGRSSDRTKNESKEARKQGATCQWRGWMALSLLLGLTWISAIFAFYINSPIGNLVFSLVNGLQVLFPFHFNRDPFHSLSFSPSFQLCRGFSFSFWKCCLTKRIVRL
jgi:hypothetical protein